MAQVIPPSVSSLYAGALSAFLRDSGLPEPVDRTESIQRVDGQDYAQALVTGVHELGDPGLGLSFGARVGAAGFGMLGIVAATAPTLRQSIHYLTNMESLTSTLGQARARRQGQHLVLSWQPAQQVVPAVIEGILTGWVSFGRYVLGEHVDVTEVAFAHPRMSNMVAYDAALDCPVRFQAPEYAVTIDMALLDAHSRFADAKLNTSLQAWVGHCAAAVPSPHKVWTQGVAALIGHRLPFGEADEPSVAKLLGTGRRTLQRRLRDEGTSFRQILDACRAQRALLALLQGDSALIDQSAEAGFDEQSSYCRSFRKWTGYAPLAFKQRLSELYCELRPTPG